MRRLSKLSIKITAFALVIAMIMPHAVTANVEWFNLSEVTQLDWVEPFERVNYSEQRLMSLLMRMGEFDSFTAEEQWLVSEHLGLSGEAFSQEELEILLQEQEEYLMQLSQSWLMLEQIEFAGLMDNTAFFSTLTKDDRALTFRRMDIAYEAYDVTEALFYVMENDGFSFADSVRLIRIMSSGLFDYLEAQTVFTLFAEEEELLFELTRFERFSTIFDIAEETNIRRLTNSEFMSLNTFETAFARLDDEMLEFSDYLDADRLYMHYNFIETTDEMMIENAVFNAFTNENAFNEARRMFLNGYNSSDIEAAFMLGAALQVEPQLILQNDTETLAVFRKSMERLSERNDLFASNYVGINEMKSYGASILMPLSSTMPVDRGRVFSNPFGLGFGANDAVSLNTGAAMVRENILSLPGRNGLGFSLDLVYNSADAYIDRATVSVFGHNSIYQQLNPYGLGAGWRFDLPYIRNNMLYIPGRGTFGLEGNNIVREYTPFDMELAWDGTFVCNISGIRSNRALTFHNGMKYYFDFDGHIIKIVDNFGNEIRFIYKTYTWQFPTETNQLLLSRIIDTSGAEIIFEHESIGGRRTITITDPIGSLYIINMTQVIGNNFRLDSVVNQVGAMTRFEYTGLHENMSRFCFFTSNYYWGWFGLPLRALRLTAVRYPSGAVLNFEHSTRVDVSLGWVSLGWHDVYGEFGFYMGSRYSFRVSRRFFTYGEEVRRYNETSFHIIGSASTFPNATPSPWNPPYTIVVAYDNLVRTHHTFSATNLNTHNRTYIPINTSGQARLLTIDTTVSYNSLRMPNVTTITETYGDRRDENSLRTRTSSTLTTFNMFRQLIYMRDPMGVSAFFTYDNRYGLPLTTTTRPNESTTVVKRNVLCPDGRIVIRSYVYENDVLVSRGVFEHDVFGNIIRTKSFPDVTNFDIYFMTEIEYADGVMPQTITTRGVRDAEGGLANGNGIIRQSFSYDAMWRVLQETDPNGYITRWQYDGVGRITRIDFPVGGYVLHVYDDTANTITKRTILGVEYTHHYDGFGNLRTITDPDGVVILTNYYDHRMRLVATRNAQGVCSAQLVHYQYDARDRIIEVRQLPPLFDFSGATLEMLNTVALHRVQTLYFDINDNYGNAMVVTIIHGDDDAPSISSFMTQDRFGRLTQEGVIGGSTVYFEHDFAGRVIRERVVDNNGNTIGADSTFTHNIFGVTAVTNIEGNTARVEFDNLGRVVKSSDFMGNWTHFEYDSIGRVIERRMPFEDVNDTVYYAVTRYFYDNNGNIIRMAALVSLPGQPYEWSETVNMFEFDRLMSSRIGGVNGIETAYTYDVAGHVLTQTVGDSTTTFVYNQRGQLIRRYDALGQAEIYTYDLNGIVITRTDRNGTIFNMNYDHMGRVAKIEAMQGGEVIEFRAFEYTASGALRRETDGMHITTNYYDAQGRVIRQTETGGIRREYQYNAVGNRTGFQLFIDNAPYINIEYTYDVAQRLWSVYENGVFQTRHSYNANGLRTRTYIGADMFVIYKYNLAGLLIYMSNHFDSRVLSRFEYIYYLDGNTHRVVEIMQSPRQSAQSLVGLISNALGTTSGTEETTRTITYEFDLARRLIREHEVWEGFGGVSRVNGEITRFYEFDNRGNRILMTVVGTGMFEDELNYTTKYEYDLNNRLLTEIRIIGSGNESSGINRALLRKAITEAESRVQTNYVMISWVRMQTALSTARSMYNNESATQEQIDTEAGNLMAAIGNLVYFINRTALRTAITNAGWRVEVNYTSASWQYMQTRLAEAQIIYFDEDAIREQVNAAAANLTAAMNGLERVNERAALRSAITEAESHVQTNYTLISWARMQTALSTARSTYNNENATQEQINTATNNLMTAIGNLDYFINRTTLRTAITNAGWRVEVNYTPASWQYMQTRLEEAQIIYSNEDAIREQVNAAAANLTAALNGLERVSEREALRLAIAEAESRVQANYVLISWARMQTALSTARSTYNNVNATQEQINTATDNLVTAIGNLAPINQPVGAGMHVELANPVMMAGIANIQGLVTIETTIYTYDANGNQLTRSTSTQSPSGVALLLDMFMPGGVTPFVNTTMGWVANRPNNEVSTYNAFNQLVRVVTEHNVAVYTYLPNGMRQSKTVSGRGIRGSETLNHVWDGAHIVAELNESREVVNIFIRGFGLIRSEHHGFYLHNASGDVVQRVCEDGEVLHTYRYTAFGMEMNQDADNNNPFRYDAEYFDFETGRIYLRFRSLDPSTGRFTQEDPIHFCNNWYIYGNNNPIMYNDPMGLYYITRSVTTMTNQHGTTYTTTTSLHFPTSVTLLDVALMAIPQGDLVGMGRDAGRGVVGGASASSMSSVSVGDVIWGVIRAVTKSIPIVGKVVKGAYYLNKANNVMKKIRTRSEIVSLNAIASQLFAGSGTQTTIATFSRTAGVDTRAQEVFHRQMAFAYFFIDINANYFKNVQTHSRLTLYEIDQSLMEARNNSHFGGAVMVAMRASRYADSHERMLRNMRFASNQIRVFSNAEARALRNEFEIFLFGFEDRLNNAHNMFGTAMNWIHEDVFGPPPPMIGPQLPPHLR